MKAKENITPRRREAQAPALPPRLTARGPKATPSSDLEDAIARANIGDLWLYLANSLDAISQYANAGNKDAQRYLAKSLPRLEKLLTTSVAAAFGKA